MIDPSVEVSSLVARRFDSGALSRVAGFRLCPGGSGTPFGLGLRWVLGGSFHPLRAGSWFVAFNICVLVSASVLLSPSLWARLPAQLAAAARRGTTRGILCLTPAADLHCARSNRRRVGILSLTGRARGRVDHENAKPLKGSRILKVEVLARSLSFERSCFVLCQLVDVGALALTKWIFSQSCRVYKMRGKRSIRRYQTQYKKECFREHQNLIKISRNAMASCTRNSKHEKNNNGNTHFM